MTTQHSQTGPEREYEGNVGSTEAETEAAEEKEQAEKEAEQAKEQAEKEAAEGEKPDETAPKRKQPKRRPHTSRRCACEGECSCYAVVLERNRYFTGKYMTARDFADEQQYFLSHQRLHNRTLHGWGIVCGLAVKPHPNPDCRATWVKVEAGIAIDCCGREIILEKDTAFELKAEHGETLQSPVLLAIRYHEEKIECVPALYNEGACDPQRSEANRVRECAKLEVLDDIPDGCWGQPGGSSGRCKDCSGELGVTASCLHPDCACGELVPLALLSFDGKSDIEIDMLGRRRLPVAPEYLTHIAGTNWTHGEQITLDHLMNDMQGRLVVDFDRHIKPAAGEATGINAQTFVVQFVNIQRDLEFLPPREDRTNPEYQSPRLDRDTPCRAVFDIDPRYLDVRSGLAGSTVYVTLKCDFILDCNDLAVDGNHLGGTLPTGDGRPGGVFESWFRVVA